MLAGCAGGPSPEVRETVLSNGGTYNFDAESGDTIRIEADNEEGVFTVIWLVNPDGEDVMEAEVETERTLTHQAEQSGVYRIEVAPAGRASIEVYVESE